MAVNNPRYLDCTGTAGITLGCRGAGARTVLTPLAWYLVLPPRGLTYVEVRNDEATASLYLRTPGVGSSFDSESGTEPPVDDVETIVVPAGTSARLDLAPRAQLRDDDLDEVDRWNLMGNRSYLSPFGMFVTSDPHRWTMLFGRTPT